MAREQYTVYQVQVLVQKSGSCHHISLTQSPKGPSRRSRLVCIGRCPQHDANRKLVIANLKEPTTGKRSRFASCLTPRPFGGHRTYPSQDPRPKYPCTWVHLTWSNRSQTVGALLRSSKFNLVGGGRVPTIASTTLRPSTIY